MPRKLQQADVFDEFEKYGFTIEPNQTYVNAKTKMKVFDEMENKNISLSHQQLKYRISKGRPEFDFHPMRIMYDENYTSEKLSSFERFVRNQPNIANNLSEKEQLQAFNYYQKYMKMLKNGKNFTLNFEDEYSPKYYALTAALKVAGPTLPEGIRLTLYDNEHDEPIYVYLNSNVVDNFEELSHEKSDIDRHFSEDNYVESLQNLQSLTFDFSHIKQTGRRRNVGFFPYINKSDINLEKYGIFNTYDEKNYVDNCLVYALDKSGMFDTNSINLLRSFVNTRTIEMADIHEICDLLRVCLHVRTYYSDKNNTSLTVYGEQYSDKLELLVYCGHIMIDEKVNCSEFYVNNYEKVNNSRISQHERKRMCRKLNDKSYEFKKDGTPILTVIKLLFSNNMFEEISTKRVREIEWNWRCYNGRVGDSDISYKTINMPNKTSNYFTRYTHKNANLFGYSPECSTDEWSEYDDRMRELQQFVDNIPLRNHVNVNDYFRYSELMQKIMFEFGCFDNVYMLAGDKAKSIRNECVFNKPHLPDGVKRYYSNEKLYYVDINSAYLSVIDGIPTGVPDDDLNFSGKNAKIVDLIRIFQQARDNAKMQKNDKFATTLKFMITSCWGYSISKPTHFKKKYVKNVDKALNEYGNKVVAYRYNNDGISGIIKVAKSISTHYSYPQFARLVLDNYRKKLDEICKIITPLYYNVDAFLITEQDYNKLVEKGMIGNEIGQMKIEKVFTEFCCISARKYVATLESGDEYFHCIKNMSYDDVKRLSRK